MSILTMFLPRLLIFTQLVVFQQSVGQLIKCKSNDHGRNTAFQVSRRRIKTTPSHSGATLHSPGRLLASGCKKNTEKHRRTGPIAFLTRATTPSSSFHPFLQDTELSKAASVSAQILKALRDRTPKLSCSSPVPLDLEIHFYDPTTGLHSEGVWHNALAGIASLKLISFDQRQGMSRTNSSASISSSSNSTWKESIEPAVRIADSLWGCSFDGTSFKRRAWNGLWDHTSLSDTAPPEAKPPPEQANYYKESDEHRCVQHGMALVFWSQLVRHFHLNHVEKDNESEYLYSRYKQQFDLLRTSFLNQFWVDGIGKWSTVSDTQGRGTLLRRSASSGKAAEGLDPGPSPLLYYRAVDQAVAVLACLEVTKTLKQQGEPEECGALAEIIQKTCYGLLSTEGFGYGHAENDDHTRSYIGLSRNRNFWHDGWALLALVGARRYVWQDEKDAGEENLLSILERLISRYGHQSLSATALFDGTVWHWSRSLKKNVESGNVRYCGDNSLLYAICSTMGLSPDCGRLTYQSAFWEFIDKLRSRDDERLASVADVYEQVRLHPNTELAALVLWQIDDNNVTFS